MRGQHPPTSRTAHPRPFALDIPPATANHAPMRILANLAGAVLGLFFIAVGGMVLLGLAPNPEPPPEGSPTAHFFAAMGPTGYITFVKVLEVLGGVLVAVPRTRNLGLLVLGPILVNILLFHQLVAQDGLLQPLLLAPSALALFLLAYEGRAWWQLVSRQHRPA